MTQREDHAFHDIRPDLATGVPMQGGRGQRARGASQFDIRSFYAGLVPTLAGRAGVPFRLVGGVQHSRSVETFVDLLLKETDDRCEEQLYALAAESQDPQEVADEVLAPAARLLGDYWRMDICDFMQVTVGMARLHRLFWNLTGMYPALEPCRPGRTALLTPLPPEQHGFGLVVVEDALRRAGWQVDCCGVGEEDAFFELLASNAYTMVGVSVSGSAIARGLPAFIRKSRKTSRNASARFMLGGSLFVDKPELADGAGADDLALDASSAVMVAEAAAAAVELMC